MTLYDLKEGEKAIITKVKGRGAFRKRIIEMGFVRGEAITRVKNAPLKDPIEFSILGYNVSLRKSEALQVEAVIESEIVENHGKYNLNGTPVEKILKKSAREKGKTIEIALVGNPNCGKTTLFNYASGANEHIGNYGGVTVDIKKGTFKMGGYRFNLTDLPGTYSLSTYSPEELFVRRYIFHSMPDVIINVVDASNLERNLYLTTQLIDMDVKVIMALNMYDELEKKGDLFNQELLGKMIGIPIVPTVGSRGKGVKELFKKAIDIYEDKDDQFRHVHINYGLDIEMALDKIQDIIWENKEFTDRVSSRFYAIKLMEKDEGAHEILSSFSNYKELKELSGKKIKEIEEQYKEDIDLLIADARYGFIKGALKETFRPNQKLPGKTISEKIDQYLTHKYLGFPIFIFFLWLMFQSTFSLGQYPMDWIDQLVGFVGERLNILLPNGILKDLLIDGIISGVGGVIIFLPNILILFFFISLMESTGYMTRVAFIMDKLMHKIGLHGKSFIPLIMGFGCNVPAIMATRTIENRKDRLLTILINPFMSCSARLPVYILLIAAFFPKRPVLILFTVYMIGITFAILFSILFKKTMFRGKEAPFVMELPPYRIPTGRSITRHIWFKASQYLKKMGGVILIASMIIWALGYFPRHIEFSENYDELISQAEMNYNEQVEKNPAGKVQLEEEKTLAINNLLLERDREKQEKSFIGQLGKTIEPVIRPLGFDWKIGVSLLTGIAAKEVVISTMGVLYNASPEEGENNLSLTNRLRELSPVGNMPGNQAIFTTPVALALLMFVLLYFPCVAVVSAVKKETNGWKWPIFMVVYTTGFAWLMALVIYQVGNLFI